MLMFTLLSFKSLNFFILLLIQFKLYLSFDFNLPV